MQGRRLQSKVEGAKQRDSSPGRSKRDGKPATERPSLRDTSGVPDVTVPDQKRRRRLQDPLPLEVSLQETVPKPEYEIGQKGSDPKFREPTVGVERSSNPTHVPHAGSYFQHDERSAVPGGRNIRRRSYDRANWNDRTKGQPGDRYRDRADLADERGKEDRGQVLAKEDGPDKVWRHDRFFELESNELQERRKPPFREKKVFSQVGNSSSKTIVTGGDKHDGFNKVSDSVKREGRVDANESQHEVERWSERDPGVGRRGRERDRGHVVRNEDIERGRWLEKDPQIEWSQYRGRFGSASRGRERLGRRFDASERNQFHSRTFGGEKWKHDLFDQANRSPTPKNEEDQIARIESLLAG
eukprot:Gb_20212 [translate_table: standard]